MAVFCDGRPAIILASGRDSPPWVAYQLAHELGHIFHGHIIAGSERLVDGDFEVVDDEDHEGEADRFACELLTAEPRPSAHAILGMTAPRLVAAANNAARTKAIDPGVCALVYGKNAGRMAVAQNALKLMGLIEAHER